MKNKKSKLSIFSKFSSYFDSEWSFALHRTTEKKTKVGFLGGENELAVISTTVRNIVILGYSSDIEVQFVERRGLLKSSLVQHFFKLMIFQPFFSFYRF